MSDLPEAELKRLYASLSQDMRAAATVAGDDALKAFNRANKFYSAGMKRINGALNLTYQKKILLLNKRIITF